MRRIKCPNHHTLGIRDGNSVKIVHKQREIHLKGFTGEMLIVCERCGESVTLKFNNE